MLSRRAGKLGGLEAIRQKVLQIIQLPSILAFKLSSLLAFQSICLCYRTPACPQ